LVDLLFVAAVVGLLIAIYKLKFSKESLTRDIEEETARAARERE
jgi:DDRGK domain-containing protein 1